MALLNLKRPQNISSGVGEYVLLAPIDFFSSIKYPVGPHTTPGDEVTIKQTHLFKDGYGWLRFQLAPEKNDFNASTIGDKGFQKLSKQLNIVIPGSYAEAHEVMKNLLNTPLIAISPDSNCASGIFYQLGTECVPAYMEHDFTTGTTRDGIKGYTARITSTLGFVQIYTGEPTPELTEPVLPKVLLTELEEVITDESGDAIEYEG
ncbi:MAG TPA: hypothetical protein PKY29_04370 [Ferruginibacter sp.]|nr:hypothetical protein [Ferruginibacter sp.]HRQ20523.1 hypothetical protein [Ferruginibacter sp.]